MHTCGANVWDPSLVQGPFSVTPCQTLACRFAIFASLYTSIGGRLSGRAGEQAETELAHVHELILLMDNYGVEQGGVAGGVPEAKMTLTEKIVDVVTWTYRANNPFNGVQVLLTQSQTPVAQNLTSVVVLSCVACPELPPPPPCCSGDTTLGGEQAHVCCLRCRATTTASSTPAARPAVCRARRHPRPRRRPRHAPRRPPCRYRRRRRRHHHHEGFRRCWEGKESGVAAAPLPATSRGP